MPLVSMRMTLSALFLFIIAGCGDPGLDGTSEETFQASLATLKAPLSEPEQQRLDQILEGFEFLFSDNVIGVLDNSENVKNRIRSRLDGLTAEELIEEKVEVKPKKKKRVVRRKKKSQPVEEEA